MRNQSRYNLQGFSLMEMVVAMGIFAIIVLATVGLFSSSLRGQQNVVAQTRVERESQLILETIARKIRTSRVDYTAYASPIVNPVTFLSLVDQADSQVQFQLDAVDNELEFSLDGGAPLPISSQDVEIIGLDFFIEPTLNPFGGGNPPTTQPRVTMILTLRASEGTQQVETTIQQTVPQRGGAF